MIYPRLHLDKETRSVKELGRSTKNVGLYRYAIDPTTSIWMFSYRFEFAPREFGPVRRWWRDQTLPDEVVYHIAVGLPVLGHNVTFERVIWNTVLARQTGRTDLPLISIEQTDCTMARARAVGLPGDLERAARIVNAPVQKDLSGAGTMKKMSKPRSVTFETEEAGRAYWAGAAITLIDEGLSQSHYQIGHYEMVVTWWYDLTLRNDLSLYCDDDVLAECGVDAVVPMLSADERATWELDQRINDRGVMIDKTMARRIIDLVELAVAKANREVWTLTAGKVKKCTDHGAVKRWLNARWPVEQGEDPLVTSVAKGETEDLIGLSEARGDAVAQRVIELHNAGAKARTEKFKKALDVICFDDRARGQFSYHVANATGRWGAQGIQLQNLMRVDEDRDLPTVLKIIDVVMTFADPTTAFDLIGVL